MLGVLLGAGLLVLASCGSGTKTVSVGGAPPASSAAQPNSTRSAAKSAPPPAARNPAGGSAGSATATTRSAPEPAFSEEEHSNEGLGGATAVLRARGYSPANTSDYHSNQALRVLIGIRAGSGDGYGQQAFFFVNNRYLGTDTSAPSAALRVVAQSDTEVTLAYPLYRNGDALCCPAGGHTNVRFQLDNGRLTPLDQIPPLHSSTGLSRY
jgi:hypothetical protein